MEAKSLGFIGGGRITRIFLQAFVNKKAIFNSISVFDTNPEVLEALKLQYPFLQVKKSLVECARNDIVLLALHHPILIETLHQIKDKVKEQTILISPASHITIEQLSLGVKCRQIVRILPTPISIINQGYNPVAFKSTMTEIQKWSILKMLNILGHAFETSEEKLEGYAVISSMLPAYFWFQWHEIETIGIHFGMSLAECRESIYETMIGALNLMYRSGMNPEKVMNLISSKPLHENEEQIKAIYQKRLNEIYNKIKPVEKTDLYSS